MALCIDKNKLSKDQIAIIRKLLVIKPKIEGKYKSNGKLIYFFEADQTTVKVPYLFGASLMNVIPNISNTFIGTNISFIGELRPPQEYVFNEGLSLIQSKGTVTLALHPGFGKTVLGVKFTTEFKLLTVVIVHREILVGQWKGSYSKFSDAKIWVVGDKQPEIFDVIICMPGRWSKIPDRLRSHIGVLIIDEAHCLCTESSVKCLLSFQPRYIIALSATPERDDNLHQMLYALCGEHAIYRQSEIPFVVVKVNTGFIPDREHNPDGTVKWNSVQKSLSVSDDRNELILKLVKNNLTENILILTKLVDHAKHLQQLISQFEDKCDYLCGNKNVYNDGKVLVGTVSKIGTGFDQASSCANFSGNRFNVLILATSIKKYSTIIQSVGRVFRCDNPLIYHLVDEDGIIKNHWYFCRKWYLSRNADIREIKKY